MGQADAHGGLSALRRLLQMDLTPVADLAALELAMQALCMPLPRRFEKGRQPWRQRCEPAAEVLEKLFPTADAGLLEKTRDILEQAARPQSAAGPARLLADAMNLNDFGITGLLQNALQAGSQSGDLKHLLKTFIQHERYGYWEARLKEDFYFEPARKLAQQRLEHIRQFMLFLKEEIDVEG